MDKVKIGIIGIGNMGSGHCGTLLKGAIENAELAAVADVKENRRKWAAENLPDCVKIFESDKELIRSGSCGSDRRAPLSASGDYDPGT